jgi:hypothetical protein
MEASAQGRGDRVPPPARECDQAVANAGATANSAQFARAFQNAALLECGERGALALAEALRKVPAVSDTLLLGSIFYTSSTTRHPAILRTALSLAGNRSLPLVPRIIGLQVAMRQMNSDVLLYGRFSQLAARPVGRFCQYDYVLHSGYNATFPMPPGFRAEIAAAMRRISGDAGDSAIIRDLAACVLRNTEQPTQ